MAENTFSGGGAGAVTTMCSVSSENAAVVNCCGLSRLIRKLKKRRSKMLCPNRQTTSLQCRYDPLSYSLNFDATGSSGDNEDYYKFYAFSSRFVVTPRNESQRLPNPTASH